jgi:hypothetical protein
VNDDSAVTEERARLREIIATPSVRREPPEVRERRLAAVSADALVDLVLDESEPWWRRRVCAWALAGRVPRGRAMALVDCVRRADVTREVREAVLDVVTPVGGPHRDVLLSWLPAQEDRWFAPAALRARARLGDLTAARPLAALAADPWTHRRAAGEEAIDALIEVRGLPAVLTAFGVRTTEQLATSRSCSEAERLLGLRLRWHADAPITSSLADDSVVIARAAYDLLAETGEEEDTLIAMLEERRPGQLWALAVLARRGPIRDRWETLGAPRVEVPGLPSDVRRAIVREYTPGQRETDPRWLLEAACAEPDLGASADGVARPPGNAGTDRLQRAAEALAAAGLHPHEPVPAGDHHGQGDGTYHVIGTDAGDVRVSTLGPFFDSTDGDARVTGALREADFRYIDATLDAIRVPGLYVYYFGDRTPLTVGTLLFYWQD